MATTAQKNAAKKNIVKAQKKWKGMTKRQHSLAQPEGRARKKPGTTGKGEYYRIVVRPKSAFKIFRVQDVGRSGHTERLAGKRESGSWDTLAWFISKRDAHVSAGKLVIDSPKVKTVLKQIRGRSFTARGTFSRPSRERMCRKGRSRRWRSAGRAQRILRRRKRPER